MFTIPLHRYPCIQHSKGLTLIELVISIVILGIALTGILGAVATATRSSVDPMIYQQAISVARAYLEEIMNKSYLDPDTGTVCPAAEASRDLYDNICDYIGLDDNGARDQGNNAITGLNNYRVRVTIDNTTANLNGITGMADVLRIDVRVSFSNILDFNLSGYRAGL